MGSISWKIGCGTFYAIPNTFSTDEIYLQQTMAAIFEVGSHFTNYHSVLTKKIILTQQK